jgi:glycosyltransferase involved in cell wall biosynthesis
LEIVFFTPDLSNNSLGRTLCLWEMAHELGWKSTVVSPKGDSIWAPLRDTEFARACLKITADEMARSPILKSADVYVAVKPLPDSFSIASVLSAQRGIPLLLDVDDPDLESVLSWQRPMRRFVKSVLRYKQISGVQRLARAARRADTIVSNPVLQKRYGGVIIPHTRRDAGNGARHVTRSPHVAFVGTNHSHKGLTFLRDAVERLQSDQFSLTITDHAPLDAKPWESWTGPTTFGQGQKLVANCDIVVIPSIDLPFARGQLPAKLMDAMLLGRAIVVSDIEPMPWALGGAGRIVAPGSVSAIENALRSFVDPAARQASGDLARVRAQSMFTLEHNTGKFAAAVLAAKPTRSRP